MGRRRNLLESDISFSRMRKNISLDDTVSWQIGQVLHCEDGPARIHPDGREEWYRYGQRHCSDGPAVIDPSGIEEWWQNGKRHRSDGPAIIRSVKQAEETDEALQEWWQDGELHRDRADGSAVIYDKDNYLYYQHGENIEGSHKITLE